MPKTHIKTKQKQKLLNHTQHTQLMQNLITSPTLKLDIVLNVQNINQRKELEDVPECR